MNSLLAPDIQDFIEQHKGEDVKILALKKAPNNQWNYPQILNQIKSYQKALKKIPSWCAHKNILYPDPNIMEQGSSEATANFKASLCRGETFVDLTAGAGIDTCALAPNFKSGISIDINPENIERLENNLKILGHNHIKTQNIDAEEFTENMQPVDWIIIDPARRDQNKKGKFLLQETSPNIIELLPILKRKTKNLLLKTSPIYDLQQGCNELTNITNIYIIEHEKDCKEVTFHLNFTKNEEKTPHIHAISLNNTGKIQENLSFSKENEEKTPINTSKPLKYIYEPNKAIMKAGAFKTLCAQLNIPKLHANTHLYTSDTLITNFPGRIFELKNILPPNPKAIPHTKANLTIRNFPATIDQLKKKLKIKDGGDHYLFACTLENEEKVILDCIKPLSPSNP